MRSRLILCLAVLALTAGVTVADVTMTNIGSFSIGGTKPTSGPVGYYGNAVAFVPAGQDSIDQDTLVITWAQTDPVNATRRLFLFRRITIPAPNGTPTILATATLPSDVTIAGTPIGATTTGTKDLIYDPVTKKVVGAFTVGGNRLFAFDLFSTDVTLGSVSYSAPTGDSQSPGECFFLANDGRYTSFYKTSTTTWRKISLGRNELDGVTPFVKVDVPIASFTGWYPDPSAYPYGVDSFCATGGAGFFGSTSLVIRAFKNSLEGSQQQTRLYVVGQTMDAAAINAYMDLGAVPAMTNNSYIGYGMAFDRATGNTYIRSGYINDASSASHNRIFMVNLASSCDSIAPDAVADLVAGSIEPRALTLSWTAPNDASGILDGAASYDIRYSSSPIDDTNWDAATQVTGEPQPSSAGAVDSIVISGLTAATDYYFAVKSTDTCGNVSALSNVASGRTTDPDITPPAAVGDLVFSDLHPNSLVLHWTATGDDGMVGQAVSCDLRYGTSPIDATNFDAATPIGVAAPKAPGAAESLEMHNLSGGATYYFAIKVIDEWPNVSEISNVLVVPMPAADSFPPLAAADLRVSGMQASKAHLKWTAPADVGSAGIARYEVRYSTSPIDEGNWASATVANPPAVAAPGTTVTTIIGGLAGNTTYYFAVKSFDWAEPANVSDLSNVIDGTTLAPVLPVTVHNPWIANDRVPDCRDLGTMAATFGYAYTPEGVVAPASNQDKAINVYNNVKRRVYHWADPPNRGDVIRNFNVYGWSLCGGHAVLNCTVLEAMGIGSHSGSIASGAHTFHEAFYDGSWHAFDTMTTMYLFDRSTPPKIASVAQINADKTLMTSAVAEGRACPGFLLCPDDPVWFANGTNSWSIIAVPGGIAPAHSMNMDLRFGESLDRTWKAWFNQHPTPKVGADSIPGLDAPYHHDAARDWKDTVNFPYWEPYGLTAAQNAEINIGHPASYRRWANGTCELKPDFGSAAYQTTVHGTPVSISTLGADGLMPELHPAALNTTAEIIFKIALPFLVTDASISGEFLRTSGGDVAKVLVSTNGTTYTQVWEHTGLGTTQLANLNLRSSVFDKYIYYVKIQLKAVNAKSDAGVNNLVINTIFEHNKGGAAYLDKGVNNLTVTFDNPAELAASGAAFKVIYEWKEYDGTGWMIDKSHEQYILTSPTTFTITTGGTKVPRTESIRMELGEPPFDPEAPAAITDLAVESTDSGFIGLTWTATADDGVDPASGTASLYDIRYALSPISDEAAWEAATQATGEPSPAMAGTVEHFRVTGLEASTTYYFAIKVADKMPNWSGLSNGTQGRTAEPDIIPPAWVGSLIARTSKASGGVDLTWTATGDDQGSGTAKTYHLRYSTSPIVYDDGDVSWDLATAVAGLPAPKVAGAAETFTVTGLTGGTKYYFALKVADERPNLSEVSNTSSAVASSLGEKVLQNGTAGYNGCRDNYVESGTHTAKFGTYERMRVASYADLNDTERGFVKFDLSGIPTGTVIHKATLCLYSYETSKMQGSTGFYAAHRITRAWNEVNSTYDQADTGVNWTTAGGDFDPVYDALSPKKAPKVPSWYEWDVTARTQQWINDGTGNFGWLIKAQVETSHLQDQFYQSDTAAGTYRPKLIITDCVEPVAGDISRDGKVNVIDLLIFADSFAATCQVDRNYDPRCDFNSDSIVDVLDLLTFAEFWPQ